MRHHLCIRHHQVALLCCLLGCSNRVVYVDRPADADVADVRPVDASDSSRPRTCDDLGKGPGIDSCCDGGFCAGACTSSGYCICPEALLACPEGSVCCPGLGCTAPWACASDAGRD